MRCYQTVLQVPYTFNYPSKNHRTLAQVFYILRKLRLKLRVCGNCLVYFVTPNTMKSTLKTNKNRNIYTCISQYIVLQYFGETLKFTSKTLCCDCDPKT